MHNSDSRLRIVAAEAHFQWLPGTHGHTNTHLNIQLLPFSHTVLYLATLMTGHTFSGAPTTLWKRICRMRHLLLKRSYRWLTGMRILVIHFLQQQMCCAFSSNLIFASWDLLPRPAQRLRLLSSQMHTQEACCFISHSEGRLRETLQSSDRVAAEKNSQLERGWGRVTARRTKIESNWYLNTKIVEEISQKRWRQKRKQSRESWRGGESDSSFCWEYISLSLSLRGYLHLGPTLTAPAIP